MASFRHSNPWENRITVESFSKDGFKKFGRIPHYIRAGCSALPYGHCQQVGNFGATYPCAGPLFNISTVNRKVTVPYPQHKGPDYSALKTTVVCGGMLSFSPDFFTGDPWKIGEAEYPSGKESS